MGNNIQSTLMDRREIVTNEEILRAIVREEVTARTCACNLSREAQEQMAHGVGVIEDLGGGSYAKGWEVVRENHKYTSNLRIAGAKIRMTVILSVTAGAVAFVGGLITYWIKFHGFIEAAKGTIQK